MYVFMHFRTNKISNFNSFLCGHLFLVIINWKMLIKLQSRKANWRKINAKKFLQRRIWQMYPNLNTFSCDYRKKATSIWIVFWIQHTFSVKWVYRKTCIYSWTNLLSNKLIAWIVISNKISRCKTIKLPNLKQSLFSFFCAMNEITLGFNLMNVIWWFTNSSFRIIAAGIFNFKHFCNYY